MPLAHEIETTAATLLSATSTPALIAQASALKNHPDAIEIFTLAHKGEAQGHDSESVKKILISGLVGAAKAQGIALLTCPGCDTPNFGPAGLKAHRCKGIKRRLPSSTSKPPSPAQPDRETILAAAQASLEKHRDAVIKQEEAFHAATLGNRLSIGLACLKAHVAFAAKDPKETGARKGKKAVTRDTLFSFEGWLEDSAAWLKRPVAYKYMSALRGLGLDHTATDRDVARELKKRARLGDKPTLKALIAAATEAVEPPALPPAPPEQLTLDDYLATLKAVREDAEAAIEQANAGMPDDLRKVLTARFYASLHALTGTHWQPSDDPHELGTIDPDSITL